MASPVANAWMGQAPGQPAGAIPPSEAEEFGMQVRSMGLKVHYTFDKDSKVNCLARWPQTLQVQALPLDESTWIGVVDLRTCLQAVAQGSPEIVSQNEHDYTVYAFDYSEPDTPLVGQGMMSWALDSSSPSAPEDGTKMITGRVTKNMLALFGNGVRETLEVKLRLTAVQRIVRPDANGAAGNAPTPTDTTEWNSFLQANPTLGRSGNIATMNSPSLAPVRPDMSQFQQPSLAGSRPGSRPPSRQSSMPPSYVPAKAGPPMLAPRGEESASAPMPAVEAAPPSRPSRPSSRTRSRVPTGRPRGRPRKRQPVDGNTSAAEEQPTDADGDDGPKRKRAKTTKANYPTKTSLDAPPDSLRVAASTSGSLRTLRPIMAAPAAGGDNNNSSSNNNNATTPGSHLQDVPRVPTPVPQGLPPSQTHARKMMAQKARRGSMADFDSAAFPDHMYARLGDARSPTDSVVPSPENYTPEDSPADIGSSPPVPRSTTYVPQSSPIPSSPILPPMPRPQPDSGFMSGGMDDIFDEDDCVNDNMPPPPTPHDLTAPTPTPSHPLPSDSAAPSHPVTSSTNGASVPTTAAPASRAASQPPTQKNGSRQTEQFPFMAINPGPMELLPVTSIYNPPQPPKTRPAKGQKPVNASAKAITPSLQRSYSEPAHPAPVQQDQGQQDQQQQPSQLSLALPSESDRLPEASMPMPTEAHPSRPGSSAPTPMALPLMDSQTMSTDDINELTRLLATEDERASSAETPAMAASAAQFSLPQLPMHPTHQHTASDSAHMTRPVIPASDPPVRHPLSLPSAPLPPTAFSEAPCPPSDTEPPPGRFSKNLVRKAAIRERLQKAIESGETPPFCQNCGAIQTPTWRKMWTQDHDGEPGYHEYSEKPGHVTAIDILKRNEEGNPTKYRLVKKALSPTEDSKLWTQMLLCNPCGIWLGKFKSHRPRDRWDKDASRLNQARGRKSGKSGSRSKKARTKSDTQLQPTSDVYFTTDPAAPPEFDDTVLARASTQLAGAATAAGSSAGQLTSMTSVDVHAMNGSFDSFLTMLDSTTSLEGVMEQPDQDPFRAGSNQGPAPGSGSAAKPHGPGSTHSRGSGTAKSPITINDCGTTRRLLFPSPRKDGVPKVLGELNVNTMTSSPTAEKPAAIADSVEAAPADRPKKGTTAGDHDDMADLFGTPPPASRPSTPPPRSGSNNAGPFKTPTRPTPSHRPITRSVSKSIRSGPSEALTMLQRTPSKTPSRTPRSAPTSTSASKRRAAAAMTPGRQGLHPAFHLDGMPFDTPITSTLNQLLSEANEFTTGSPSHGLLEMDLAHLDGLDSDGLAGFHSSAVNMDFSSYLDTDLVLPSSSPQLGRKGVSRRSHHEVTFGEALSFDTSDGLWPEFNGATHGEEATAEGS